MKVLHVWNAGRVGSILARHFEDSKVYLATPHFDPFCIGEDPTVRYCTYTL